MRNLATFVRICMVKSERQQQVSYVFSSHSHIAAVSAPEGSYYCLSLVEFPNSVLKSTLTGGLLARPPVNRHILHHSKILECGKKVIISRCYTKSWLGGHRCGGPPTDQ